MHRDPLLLNESRLASRQDVVVNRLESRLARLVEEQVLSASQAEELVDAARADRLDALPVTVEQAPLRSAPRSSALSHHWWFLLSAVPR